MSNPITIVKIAQTTVRYPPNFNQPRVIGITIAGMVIKKVKKTMTAFPMAATPVSNHSFLVQRDNPPFNGHISKRRSRATLSRLGVEVTSAFVTRAKIMSTPPEATNNKSMTIYDVRILSLIFAVFRDPFFRVFVL